jgi:hypothetical protein
MSDQQEGRELEAWVISAAGQDVTRVFTAPVDMPGWQERPWVKLRPLTAREALQRQSLGTRDEYRLGPDGETTLVRRSYDLEAMTELDLRCCLVDFLLPVRDEDGRVKPACMGDEWLPEQGLLLDHMPPALAAWLNETIQVVNMRRPEDAAILSDAKKG